MPWRYVGLHLRTKPLVSRYLEWKLYTFNLFLAAQRQSDLNMIL
jgi:hypothetical protein